MKNSFVRYIVTTLSFSFIAGVAAFLLAITVPATAGIIPMAYFIIGYFFILTVSFHYGLLRSMKGRPQDFIRYFMGATTFKLLIHLAVVVVYALLHREQALPFILSFFALYILFMIYEVRFAMNLNKKPLN
jgi:L-asparagine transporter-like permease